MDMIKGTHSKKDFVKCRKEYVERSVKAILTATNNELTRIAKVAGLESFEEIKSNISDKAFKVNGHRISGFKIDRYNNPYIVYHKQLPLHLLPGFAFMIESVYIDPNGYDDQRAYIGAFIDYFKEFSNKLSVDDIVFMMNECNFGGDRSFGEWLIGNLQYGYKYTEAQITEAYKLSQIKTK
jgi:hypothetical protein